MSEDRDQLLHRLDELTKRLEAIRADLARGLDRDSEEQALQLENFEVLQEIHRVTEAELQRIRAALAASDED